MASLKADFDDLRIIGHAITWVLYGPYEHTLRLHLNEQEKEILNMIFRDECRFQSVFIENGEPYSCEDNRTQLPQNYLYLVINAVASFFEELKQSSEIEILTGLPSSRTFELLSRLRETFPQISLHSKEEVAIR